MARCGRAAAVAAIAAVLAAFCGVCESLPASEFVGVYVSTLYWETVQLQFWYHSPVIVCTVHFVRVANPRFPPVSHRSTYHSVFLLPFFIDLGNFACVCKIWGLFDVGKGVKYAIQVFADCGRFFFHVFSVPCVAVCCAFRVFL